MSHWGIVCDVDNTILTTRPRVRRCLEAIGRPDAYEKGGRSYGGFKAFLSKEETERFFDLFLSERYLHLDEPLPGASEVLRGWVGEGRALIYLTGRHDAGGDSMRAGTLRWLERHGYPLPDGHRVELVMKPRRRLNDMAFKRRALEELVRSHTLRVGLGDLPEEGELYASFGLQPILLSQAGLFSEEALSAAPGVIVARSWPEVAASLRRLDDTALST